MIFVHLLNDNSGSPRVLKSVIEAIIENDSNSVLFIGSTGFGILESVSISKNKYFYRRSNKKIQVLFYYLVSQFHLFFKLCFDKKLRNQKVIYINTVLPFGAAIYGKLFRKKIIYHIHEISLTPPLLFKILMKLADIFANLQIYVSNTQLKIISPKCSNTKVIHNSVSNEIYQKSVLLPKKLRSNNNFRILMLSSMKAYKGVDVFLKLCSKMHNQNINWTLILNEELEDVKKLQIKYCGLDKLRIVNSTFDIYDYYLQSDLVVNFSYVDQWIETFGLTIIEAFSFGLPVIAPPIGGPTEIVTDKIDGYLINSYDVQLVQNTIEELSLNSGLYDRLSLYAKLKSLKFKPERFSKEILEAVGDVIEKK